MSEYDFIVVGGGAAGCALASRLARSPRQPSVLLVEAGGSNDNLAQMSGDERFRVAFEDGSPLNWGFTTEPQRLLGGRRVDYSRGRGLGGSTAINFCGWVVGSRDDFDRWAEVVGDEAFGWESVQGHLKRVERAHLDVPEGFRHLIRPRVQDHGTSGPIDVSYQDEWRPSVKDVLMAASQRGHAVNPDINDGDPMGMGIGTVCILDGQRISSTAYLTPRPPSLTVLTDCHVARVVLDGSEAKGIQAVDGQTYRARNDVVICAGALSSPQILLLSGIGPADELRAVGVEPRHSLPGVGRNLEDHCLASVGIVVKGEDGEPSSQSPTPMGFFQLPAVLGSVEFARLPESTRDFLTRRRVPSFELATHTPPRFVDGLELHDGERHLGAFALLMNPQSRGSVTLASPDPLADPVMDPRFLDEAFDRRALIEATRETMAVLTAPVLEARTVRKVSWPADDSDEAIWEHIKTTLGSSWHMCGTVRMGRRGGGDGSCVDPEFRVHGLKGLRVVDLSVCPAVPSNHTQTTAFVLGEIAGGKMVDEYSLG